MKETGPTTEVALALPLARQVDEVCCRFEAAWKAGQRPRIEAYLADLAEPGRDLVQRELIALEIAFRRRAGDCPQAEEYRARYPALDLVAIASLLAAPPSPEGVPGATAAENELTGTEAKRLLEFKDMLSSGRLITPAKNVFAWRENVALVCVPGTDSQGINHKLRAQNHAYGQDNETK